MAEQQVHESAGEEKEATRAQTEEEEESLVDVVDQIILDPLAVLAGALKAAKEDEEINCRILGRLLSTLIRGARVELSIHENGGYGAREIRALVNMRVSVEV